LAKHFRELRENEERELSLERVKKNLGIGIYRNLKKVNGDTTSNIDNDTNDESIDSPSVIIMNKRKTEKAKFLNDCILV